jgi:hypothetical protein
MFFEEVEHEGKRVPRFARVGSPPNSDEENLRILREVGLAG